MNAPTIEAVIRVLDEQGGRRYGREAVSQRQHALQCAMLAQQAGAATLNYGLFVNAVVNFLIIALVIFLVVRSANRLQALKAGPAAAPTTRDCPQCLSTIPLKATRCAHCTSTLPAA